MRIKSSAIILLLAALTLCACQPGAERTEADVAAIQFLVQAWGAAAEAGDVDQMLTFYDDNIVQMPPDMPPNRGKQAVEEYYRAGFELFSVGVTWPVEGTEEIIVADGWAFYLSEYLHPFGFSSEASLEKVQGSI